MTTPAFCFFDSHGSLWQTCDASASGAQAFGPTGTALPVDPSSVGLDTTDRTAFQAAEAAGRVDFGNDDAFPTLLTVREAAGWRRLRAAGYTVLKVEEIPGGLWADLDASTDTDTDHREVTYREGEGGGDLAWHALKAAWLLEA